FTCKPLFSNSSSISRVIENLLLRTLLDKASSGSLRFKKYFLHERKKARESVCANRSGKPGFSPRTLSRNFPSVLCFETTGSCLAEVARARSVRLRHRRLTFSAARSVAFSKSNLCNVHCNRARVESKNICIVCGENGDKR